MINKSWHTELNPGWLDIAFFVDSAGYSYFTYTPQGITKQGVAFTPLDSHLQSDSLVSTSCVLPATFAAGLFCTIADSPASGDSVTIEVDYGDGAYGFYPVRTYRLPFWSASGTYGFGSVFSNLGTYTYTVPGIYRPTVIVWRTGGANDTCGLPPVTAGANCSSTVTGISVSVSDYVASSPCVLPTTVNCQVNGSITGYPSATDSAYIVIQYGDGSTDIHVVPYVLVGSTYFFTYSLNHVYSSTGGFTPSVYAITSSGLYTAHADGEENIIYDCGSGSRNTEMVCVAGTSHCSLPNTESYSFGGTITDYGATSPNVYAHVFFGDGTDTTIIVPIINDSHGEFYCDIIYFNHTFTMAGVYTSIHVDSAGGSAPAFAVDYGGMTYDLVLGSSCSPLSGTLYIDSNANCTIDPGEVRLSYWPYALINTTLGTTSYGWCDENGNYAVQVIDGYSYTFISDPFGASGSYASSAATLTPSCPSTGIYTFTSTAGSTYTQDFAFTCSSPTAMDMSVSGWGWRFTPGDTGYINIWSSNAWGFMCDSLNSTVTLIIDTNLAYIGMRSGPSPTSVSGDTLRWNFSTAASMFDFYGSVKVSTDTTATVFDTIRNTLYVSPSTITDPDLTNNTYTWQQQVRASWDPNEKQVSPQGFGAQGYIPNATPLSYMIHFQNTGSAPARNITLADTMDSNLDISTLQVISSSSPVLVYQFGNVIKFRFNDIYLPDSASDPDGSIGYISYNIIPPDSLAAGTQIANKAGIYFDYNPAVFTNSTINTIEDTIGVVYGADTVCTGSSITLSNHISGGSWSSSNSRGSVSPSGVVTGVSPGFDTITYTAYGHQTSTKVIYIRATPGAGAVTGSSTVCLGGTTALSTSIPGGTWSSYATSIATVSGSGVVTGVSLGVDTIFYASTNVCGTGTVHYPITVVNTATAGSISGPSTVCQGAAITLSASVSGGAWSVSNSSAAVSSGGGVTGVAAGTDTVLYTVTNACGAVSATKVITINPAPSAGTISGGSSVCTGTTITLSSTVSGGSWTSSSSSLATVSGGVVTGVAIGVDTIFYAVTNSCGAARVPTIITVNTIPSAGTVSGGSIVCASATLALTPTVSGGAWSASNTDATVSSAGLVTGVVAGIDTIYYTLTNSCGSSAARAIITINPMPVAGTISGVATLCAGTTATFTSSGSAGGTWGSSAGSVATISGGVVSGVSSGTAIIFYSVTNSCGTAVTRDTITVLSTPSAGLVTGSGSVCIGDSITLLASVTGGSWGSGSSAATVIAVATGGMVTGISAGIDSVFYTVTNMCGSASTYRVVTINPLPYAGAITGHDSTCTGSSVTLADTSAGGTWSSSNPAVATISAGTTTGLSTGVAYILYIVNNICGSDTATMPFTVLSAPSAGTLSGSTSACPGASITLTPTVAGGAWSSSSSAATVAGGIVSGVSAGSTIITYTVSNSCGAAYATYTVTINPLPDAGTISGAATICETETSIFANSVTGGAWSSSNSSVATVSSAGVVTGVAAGTVSISYTATNSCGAASTSSALVVTPLAACPTDIKIISKSGEEGIAIAPNPNAGSFIISLPSHENVNISIMDVQGKTIRYISITDKNRNDIPVDVSNVAAGVYLVKVEMDGRVWRKKVVVL